MSYTVGTARTIVRAFARNAGDATYYTDLMVDTALCTAAEELIRRARVFQGGVSTFDTVAGTDVYNSVLPLTSGFRPDRVSDIWISGDNVTVALGGGEFSSAYEFVEGGVYGGTPYRSTSRLAIVDRIDLLDRVAATKASGQPSMIAFLDWTDCQIFPNPDQVYTVNIAWLAFFTTWTYGDDSDETLAVPLNMPDDMLRMVMMYGAPSFLQHNDPEHAYATETGQKFDAWVQSMIGTSGGLGTQVVVSRRRRR